MASNNDFNNDWNFFNSDENNDNKPKNKDYSLGDEPNSDGGFGSFAEDFENQGKKPRKKMKKSTKVALIAVPLVTLSLVGGGLAYKNLSTPKVPLKAEEVLSNFNRYTDILSYYNGDSNGVLGSYVLQEYDLFNQNKDRIRFYNEFILPNVKVEVPSMQYKAKIGSRYVTGADFNKIEQGVSVKIIDYTAFAKDLEEYYADDIVEQFKETGIQVTDYDLRNKVTDFMCKYITELAVDNNFTPKNKGNILNDKNKTNLDAIKSKKLYTNENNPLSTQEVLPSKTVKVHLDIKKNANGNLQIDDSELDEVLFSSKDFHYLLDKFSKIALGYNVYKENPEWTNWLSQVDTVVKEKNAMDDSLNKLKEETDKNKSNSDTSTEKVDNQNSLESYREKARKSYISDLQTGVDNALSFEPVKWVLDKEKTKEYTKETVIPYNWIGVHYLTTTKDEDGKPLLKKIPLGNGKKDNPYSFYTPFLTQAIDREGKYHTIRLTMKEILTGQDAIDYVVQKDDRNKGLMNNSESRIAVVLFDAENVEDKPIKVFSELTLTDTNRTNMSRTGKMYGLAEEVEIQPHATIEIQDWVMATELNKRYAIWGKSYAKDKDVQWLRILGAKDGKVSD